VTRPCGPYNRLRAARAAIGGSLRHSQNETPPEASRPGFVARVRPLECARTSSKRIINRPSKAYRPRLTLSRSPQFYAIPLRDDNDPPIIWERELYWPLADIASRHDGPITAPPLASIGD
jgi:hypothetical protein